VDGEGIVVDQDGLSVFDLIRYRRHDHAATICAFDLIEVDGTDLLRSPIEERKDRLAALLGQRHPGIALNETYSGDGALVYQHACALGCEGIVSKRLGLHIAWAAPTPELRSRTLTRRPYSVSVRSTGRNGDRTARPAASPCAWIAYRHLSRAGYSIVAQSGRFERPLKGDLSHAAIVICRRA
jgi:hypothetical protein